MAQKKILVIVGTRPEAIKLAPVVSALRRSGRFDVSVVSTGQHREMLDQVFKLFDFKPEVDLALMHYDQTLEEIAAHLFQLLPPVLTSKHPDVVIVQGDTSTAFIGALCAFYKKIPVAHVEAGLRTYDKHNPFPEEINRKLLSSIADIHFAPTTINRENLLKEGIHPSKIHVTGNTVIDALLHVANRPYSFDRTEFEGLRAKRVVLATVHRREHFGEPLHQICNALRTLAQTIPDIEIVLPVHPNPNVSNVIKSELSIPNIRLIAPLDYEAFVHLMKLSTLILTDSGGLQEEAPSLGKPVLVLRTLSERLEAIEAGTAKLVGTSAEKIVEEATTLLTDDAAYERMSSVANPYGDGHAAERIIETLTQVV